MFRLPITLNVLESALSSISQIEASLMIRSGTEFSVPDANAWKYMKRLSCFSYESGNPRFFLGDSAKLKIPSIRSKDSPATDIVE